MKKYQEKPAETDTLFQVLNEEKEALAGVDIDLQTCEEKPCNKRSKIFFCFHGRLQGQHLEHFVVRQTLSVTDPSLSK